MKINTRKSVIFTALAVMILTTALVIGCTSPVGGSLGSWEDEPTAPGTGRVKLSINTRNASRTIMPGSLPTTQYWVTFSDSTPTALPSYSGSIITAGGGIISNIPVGLYNGITVIVCTDATSASTAASTSFARGSISGSYNITDGGSITVSTPITTTLYTVAEGKTNSGKGKFAYSFNLSTMTAALFSSASFTITERGGSAFGSPTTLNRTTNTGTVTDIPAGYYDVIVTLKDSRATPNYAYLYQILHVYQNMTSSFSYSGFSDSLFPAVTNIGSGTLTIDDPITPIDIAYNLTSTGPNASNGIVSGDATSSWYVSIARTPVADPTLTLTLTTPPAGLSIVNWYYMNDAGVKTVVPGVSGAGGNTVTLAVNTAAAPFNQKIDRFTTVEFEYDSEPFNSVPITIRITN